MGDFYDVVVLGGSVYIEYQTKATGWKNVVIELEQIQAKELEEFEQNQAIEKNKFMASFVEKIKPIK